MTTGLTVTVNGQPEPLEACGWIQRRPCGCIVAAAVAVVETVDDSGHVLATADQAHRHLNPTKRDRDRAAKAGLTTELITMQHYRDHIGAKWECDNHGPVPLTAAEIAQGEADHAALVAEFGPDEETHVVADDSDDPEHIDDCPGCDTTA